LEILDYTHKLLYYVCCLSDILLAIDRGDLAALILLDLTAAFDTADHDILLQRLHMSFRIKDVALQWFQSYLLGRPQYVRRGDTRSTVIALMCGVRAAGISIRTNTVYHVHCRLGLGDRMSWPVAIHVRRRYSGLRFLLSCLS